MDNKLYDQDDLRLMKLADSARLPGKNRLEEIKSFARRGNLKRIGIAHCISVQKEAERVKEYLSDDFEVFSIDCKCGKIPNSEILGSESKGISCNPAGQAQFLAENNTDMNIVMGLCIGHDIVFSSKSHAPSTTLLVKDREHKHNTMAIFKMPEKISNHDGFLLNN